MDTTGRFSFMLLLTFTASVMEVKGHVRLTFPPARSYALDFLDNARTPSPCGMPISGSDVVTTFAAGSTFTVKWHLAYSHTGGYIIQVIDSENSQMEMLTPNDYSLGQNDSSSMEQEVTLPAGFTCKKCYLRLVRQASEWGHNFRFWSCSDISIVQPDVFRPACSGHGDGSSGKCLCDRLYSGEQCENKDDCMEDSDCGGSTDGRFGSCIKTNATSYPIHQCYCKPGYFGLNCDKSSSVSSVYFDPTLYNKRQLAARYDLYYRVIQESSEMEIVIKVQGTSFVALGWRPSDTTASCRRGLPNIDWDTNVGNSGTVEEPSVEPESGAEPSAKPESAAEPSVEPESGAEPSVKPESEAEPSVVPESEAEPSVKPESEAEPSVKPESEAEPSVEPESGAEPSVKPESEAEPSVEPELGAEPSVKPESEAEPSVKPESEAEPSVKPESEAEPSVKPESEAEPSVKPESEAEPSVEPESGAEPSVKPESEAEPSVEPESGAEPSVKPESEAEPSVKPESEAEPSVKPESEAEPSVKPESEAEPSVKPESEAEPSVKPESEAEPSVEPESGAEPSVKPESEAEPSVKPESEAEPSVKPESEAEPSVKPESEAEPSVKPESEAEPSVEPESGAEPSVKPESEAEPTVEPESGAEPPVKPESEAEPSVKPESEAEPSVEPESGAEPSVEPESNADDETDQTIEPEPETEPEPSDKAEVEGEGEAEGEAVDSSCPVHSGDLHPMDCTDIVIGTARGSLSRILDYYTRDRSTPRTDDFYGGTDSLTAAVGQEVNGVTTLIFRKKLQSMEPQDHSFQDGDMHVIWSRGQEHGEYIHCPQSGIETNNVLNLRFYAQDDLKYHGHGPDQRGTEIINFMEVVPAGPPPTTCEWAFPSGCQGESCQYTAAVWYDRESGLASFEIKARQDQDLWTAIGFAPKRAMEEVDVVLGWAGANGVNHIFDGYIGSSYTPPVADIKSDIQDEEVKYLDGILTLEFSRMLDTGDSQQDKSFASGQCWYFLYPTVGGSYDGQSKTPYMHQLRPIISADRICIDKCPAKQVVVEQVKVVTSLRITNRDYRQEFGDVESYEAQALWNLIKPHLENELREILPNLQNIYLLGFRQGSVIADVEVIVATSDGQERSQADVDQAMQAVVQNGELGQLLVDPTYVRESIPPSQNPQPVPSEPAREADNKGNGLMYNEVVLIAVTCTATGAILLGIIYMWCKKAGRPHPLAQDTKC